MRCPNCGHWNRASFPRCFQCGAPLEPEKPDDQPREVPDVPPPSKVYIQINEDAESVFSIIEEFAGVLPFDDKASPEVIKREFGLSKNAFKRAIGHLLKEGKIQIKDRRIYLIK